VSSDRLRSHVQCCRRQSADSRGGASKGGGRKAGRSSDEAAESGQPNSRHEARQSAPAPRPHRQRLSRRRAEHQARTYLGLLVDRASGPRRVHGRLPAAWKLEEVAKNNPAAILREAIHPALVCSLTKPQMPSAWIAERSRGLCTPFLELSNARSCTDASIGNQIRVCSPAKATRRARRQDGLRRQPRSSAKGSPRTARLSMRKSSRGEDSKFGLNYIKLDGSRLHGQRRRTGHGHHGHIKYAGGSPRNFLDVGGGPPPSKSRALSASS